MKEKMPEKINAEPKKKEMPVPPLSGAKLAGIAIILVVIVMSSLTASIFILSRSSFATSLQSVFEEAKESANTPGVLIESNINKTTPHVQKNTSTKKHVEIRTTINNSPPTTTIRSTYEDISITSTPVYPSPTPDLNTTDDWWDQVQDQQGSSQQLNSEEYEQFVQESKQKMEDFKSLTESCGQEFVDHRGEYVSSKCQSLYNQ